MAFRFAKGRTARHAPGEMNKTEEAYAWLLETKKIAGEIAYYMFEPMNLRLGDKLFYSPDFMVIKNDGQVEYHEVKTSWKDKQTGAFKAGWQEDARVKIKAAAHKFWMFRFVAAIFDRNELGPGWTFEYFSKGFDR